MYFLSLIFYFQTNLSYYISEIKIKVTFNCNIFFSSFQQSPSSTKKQKKKLVFFILFTPINTVYYIVFILHFYTI